MKKSGIIFFELTLIILIFACTSDKTGLKTTDKVGLKTYALKENKVYVAWDPVTTMKDGSPISKINISYSVYISGQPSKNKDSKPVLVDYCENNSEVEDINNPPIACFMEIVETSCIWSWYRTDLPWRSFVPSSYLD